MGQPKLSFDYTHLGEAGAYYFATLGAAHGQPSQQGDTIRKPNPEDITWPSRAG